MSNKHKKLRKLRTVRLYSGKSCFQQKDNLDDEYVITLCRNRNSSKLRLRECVMAHQSLVQNAYLTLDGRG